MSTFEARIRELSERVGDNDLVGSVTFSGPEAGALHEFPARFQPPSWKGKAKLDYTTPATGPKFLERPLLQNYIGYMQRLGEQLLEPESVAGEMEKVADDLRDAARHLTPKEFDDLRKTATSRVVDDGALIHERR